MESASTPGQSSDVSLLGCHLTRSLMTTCGGLVIGSPRHNPYNTPCWADCGPGPKSQHRCPARFCVSPHGGFQPLCLGGGGHRPWAMQERPHVPTCSQTHPGGFGRRQACGFPGTPSSSPFLKDQLCRLIGGSYFWTF